MPRERSPREPIEQNISKRNSPDHSKPVEVVKTVVVVVAQLWCLEVVMTYSLGRG